MTRRRRNSLAALAPAALGNGDVFPATVTPATGLPS
jgi:hypothetical protein